MKSHRFLALEILLVVVVLILDNAESHVSTRKKFSGSGDQDPGEPSFLTPLIDSGRIREARSNARVRSNEMYNTESYAGYLTVNDDYNSNLFFWYFPAKVNSANSPVVLYLEGGPGASSLFGLFMHNGPFVVNQDSTLLLRNESWSNTHNLIYIDNPVGTGYSFTDNVAGYAREMSQIGREIRIALVQFFKLFPTLRNNDFFVTGESYAGKYLPAVCREIDNWNTKVTSDEMINLKGLAIGNGFTDPINQLVYGDYLYQIGLIDENGLEMFHAKEQLARDLILQNRHGEAVEVYGQLVDGDNTLLKNLTGYKFNFNFLLTDDPIRVENSYAWVQKPGVRRSINVGNRTFNMWGIDVAGYLRNDSTVSQAGNLAVLLENYRVLIYTGQLDIVCAYPTVTNYVKLLKWSGADDYKRSERKQWRKDEKLLGYARTGGKLTDILVRNSGHVVPMDQPAAALDMLEKFTRGRDF